MSLPQGLGSKVSEGAVGELYKVCLFIHIYIILLKLLLTCRINKVFVG
jgi:hypothetical protein